MAVPRVEGQADGHVGPRVYVYDLPSRFRNAGQRDTAWTPDAVFGGPPELVQGVEIWASAQRLGRWKLRV